MGIFDFLSGNNNQKSGSNSSPVSNPQQKQARGTNDNNQPNNSNTNNKGTSVEYPSPNIKPLNISQTTQNQEIINNQVDDSILPNSNIHIDLANLPSDEEIDKILQQYNSMQINSSNDINPLLTDNANVSNIVNSQVDTNNLTSTTANTPIQIQTGVNDTSHINSQELNFSGKYISTQNSRQTDDNKQKSIQEDQQQNVDFDYTMNNIDQNNVYDSSGQIVQVSKSTTNDVNLETKKPLNEDMSTSQGTQVLDTEKDFNLEELSLNDRAPEHPKIDNEIITSSSDAVTIQTPDGVKEILNPNDFNEIGSNLQTNNITDNSNYSYVEESEITDKTNFDNNIQSSSSIDANQYIDSDLNINNDNKIDSVDDIDVQEDEMMNTPSTEMQPEISNNAYVSLVNIRTVAFIGLNDMDNIFADIASDIVNFINTVGDKVEFIIDSNKMAGNEIIKNAKPDISITGVYLKPYFSNYSDVSNEYINRINYRSILFSNYFEKLTYIIENSDVLIVPLTSGLVNLANVANLLALQFIYTKNFKPVIMFGESWADFIESIDSYSVTDIPRLIATNPSDLLSKLLKVDKDMVNTLSGLSNSYIDKRGKGDETGFIVN